MSPDVAEPAPLTAAQREQLLQLVDRHFGIRGSEYGVSRLDSAVQQILPRTGCATVAELLSTIEEADNPRWLFDLVQFLTVGETYFLRDASQIAALRNVILPDAIRRRADDRRIRVWSAGCSTGEEVYTLAILLKERNLPADWELTLLGTDVNRESLRVAREATYSAWSFRATPARVRDGYFEPLGNTWRVKEPLRRMARFAWSNLGADPMMAPLTDIDLIVCRNVTIYFDDITTQRLYRAFVRSLAAGGWLVLGSADPLPADRDGLERVELEDAVLWRRVGAVETARPKTSTRAVVPLGGRTRTPFATATPIATSAEAAVPPAVGDELEAGLLALESGSIVAAVELLRRATFRDPSNAVAQFALARAYLGVGDRLRANAALVHTRRLLAPVAPDHLVPGSDSMTVETLRQTVQTYLEDIAA